MNYTENDYNLVRDEPMEPGKCLFCLDAVPAGELFCTGEDGNCQKNADTTLKMVDRLNSVCGE